MKILWQLQLSCTTPDGKFVMTADSNWQVFITKATEMIKLNQSLHFDVIVPKKNQCTEDIDELVHDAGITQNISLIRIPIIANAAATRFDFPYALVQEKLKNTLKKYTHVYINDPLQLSHYRALFHLNREKPKFILQTHFLDSPVARVVDPELSYWYGTVDACRKSDMFLWHSDSMQEIFRDALYKEFRPEIVHNIMMKSGVWKSGYSINEIRRPVNEKNIRFDVSQFACKTLVWVPNRVGGLGKSFDYTNNGKFLFDIVPKLWHKRKDFVIVAGNPSQKISNDEIAALCPAYVKLVDGPLNRDEYRWLSTRSNIVVGLYTNDTNGGLASLESIEFNAVPLFPDVYEYKKYFDAVDWPDHMRVKPDLSDIIDVSYRIIDACWERQTQQRVIRMAEYIRQYASYEHITASMMQKLGFVNE